MKSGRRRGVGWLRHVPPVCWLMEYRAAWLGGDLVAGVTLAAYAVPVSLAYAGLAGLSPQVGIYGYLLGGLGYALLGSSRQLAIGPTSAISLMIAGSVGAMAEGDAARYGQIASLAAFAVALLCLISWLLRLSMLVRLISDSILVGFKAGAGLTIMMTQLPSLFGVAGGGNNFFERAVLFAARSGRLSSLCSRWASRRFCCYSSVNASRLESRSGSQLSRCRSLRHRHLGLRTWGCRQQGRCQRACPRSRDLRYGCGMSRGFFRWLSDVYCWPILRAFPLRAPSQRSMDTPSTRGRSS